MVVFKSGSRCVASTDRFSISATGSLEALQSTHLPLSPGKSGRKAGPWILAFSWLLGLGTGLWCFFRRDVSFLSWMVEALERPVSIRSVLLASVLPFLLSGFFPGLACVQAFRKAFCLIFVGLGIRSRGGWLLGWLLCFPGLIQGALLYFYWLRTVLYPGSGAFYRTCLGLAAACGAASVYFFVIVPFLARLIHS